MSTPSTKKQKTFAKLLQLLKFKQFEVMNKFSLYAQHTLPANHFYALKDTYFKLQHLPSIKKILHLETSAVLPKMQSKFVLAKQKPKTILKIKEIYKEPFSKIQRYFLFYLTAVGDLFYT